MSDIITGWEFHKRSHFDEIVENYDKARPRYPSELFEDIFKYVSEADGKRALEIGAGTGKATAPILDAGYDVTAVELGANMAEFLTERFKGNSSFNVIVDSFENVPLEDESYDLIYAGSAFHWVEAEIGCPKALRLLKSGGAIALFRYNIDPADGEELYEEIQSIYRKHYCTYYTSNERRSKKSREDFQTPSGIYTGFRFEDLRAYGFRDVTMKFYDVSRMYSADEYIAYIDTMADHRGLPDENRAALYAGVKEAIIKHGGHFKIDFIFQLYIGRK